MPTQPRITISDIDRLQAALREFEAAQAVVRTVATGTAAEDKSRKRALFDAAREKLTRAQSLLDSEAAALDARTQAPRADKAWSNH